MATTSAAIDAERLAPAEPNQLAVTWRRFRKHKLAVVGLTTLITLALLCVLAPLYMPYRPDTLDLFNTFAPSTGAHWLGTDDLGRDILTRLLFAGQISLSVGLICTAIVIVIGTLIGILAGFFGGWVDTLLMRLVDLLLAIPFFPLLLVL